MTKILFQRPWRLAGLVLLGGFPAVLHAGVASRPVTPNVILMMVDDMGLGDTSAYLGKGLMPKAELVPLTQRTPQVERLANMGVLFTDAHAPSSMCSSTRYALLTGRFAHRSYLKSQGWLPHGPNPPMIAPEQPTLGSLLQRAGYQTSCVGKYHVGLAADNGSGQAATDFFFHDVDFSKPLLDGPTDHGFERFFGVLGNIEDSFDSDPRVFIRDDRWTEADPGKFPRIGMKNRQDKIIASRDWDASEIGAHYLREVLATLADLLGEPLAPSEALDSYSVLSQWMNPAAAPDERPRIIHHHSGEDQYGHGAIALRQGPYKLMVHASLPIPRSAKSKAGRVCRRHGSQVRRAFPFCGGICLRLRPPSPSGRPDHAFPITLTTR